MARVTRKPRLAMKDENKNPVESLKQAFQKQDPGTFRQLLERHPELKLRINEPMAAFDSSPKK